MDNPAAWHPDPTGRHEYRWWDGTRWTEHVADGGQVAVDPLPGGPGSQASSTPDSGTSSAGDTPGAGAAAEDRPGEPGPSEPTQRFEPQPWPGGPSTGAPGQGWERSEQWPPQGSARPTTGGTNGIAIAALAVGIGSLLISWMPVFGALVGILAVVLGFIGRSKARSQATGGQGAAIGGIVTGAVAIVISVLMTVLVASFFGTYTDCIIEGGTEAECQRELETELMRRFGG